MGIDAVMVACVPPERPLSTDGIVDLSRRMVSAFGRYQFGVEDRAGALKEIDPDWWELWDGPSEDWQRIEVHLVELCTPMGTNAATSGSCICWQCGWRGGYPEARCTTGETTMRSSVSHSQVVLTGSDWNTGRTVTVTGMSDSDRDNESVTITHSASGLQQVNLTVNVVGTTAMPGARAC